MPTGCDTERRGMSVVTIARSVHKSTFVCILEPENRYGTGLRGRPQAISSQISNRQQAFLCRAINLLLAIACAITDKRAFVRTTSLRCGGVARRLAPMRPQPHHISVSTHRHPPAPSSDSTARWTGSHPLPNIAPHVTCAPFDLQKVYLG